jgi:hypothetical protein
LLHPYIVVSGTSLDLPIIAENLREESLAELELDEENGSESIQLPDTRAKRKVKAYSQDNLVDEELEPIIIRPGPSTVPDPQMSIPNVEIEPESSKDVKCNVPSSNRFSLHHSLILPENSSLSTGINEVNRSLQKSHSTHSFCQVNEELDCEIKESLRHTYSVGSRVGEETEHVGNEHFCDTNIRHNDRYPEANDVDNLDNEIMDALTLETGNLPDLTEEQSSSIDESTRRDDFWCEALSAENLNYLNRILCFDQEGTDGHSLESEWEASGEGCEHLHLVLKYWHFLVLPYPELRQAVSWGQVKCYCINCQPDAQPPLAGMLSHICS